MAGGDTTRQRRGGSGRKNWRRRRQRWCGVDMEVEDAGEVSEERGEGVGLTVVT